MRNENLQNQFPVANKKRLFSVKIGWFEIGELKKKNFLNRTSHLLYTHDVIKQWLITKLLIIMTHYYKIDVSVQLFTQTVDTSDDEVYEFFTSPFIFTIGAGKPSYSD